MIETACRGRCRSGGRRTSQRAPGSWVEQLWKAPITGPIPYLFLDATFIDARWARKLENVSALVAYGIGLDGHRQLLAVTIGAEESEDSWSELLAQLLERGLSGVQLVVADAHAGIAKAVRRHLPEVPHQRCTVRLQRNVLTKAPQRLRSRLAKAVTQVFEAPSKAEARKRVDALAAGLGKQVPEALECLRAGLRRRPSSTPSPRSRKASRPSSAKATAHGYTKIISMSKARKTGATVAKPKR